MKLCTFRRPDGAVGHGHVVGDTQLIELGDGDLTALLTMPGALPITGTHVDLATVTLLTPVLSPGKILAAAANYQEHIAECGAPRIDKERACPRLFSKPITSLAGPDEPFAIPRISDQVDWEVELAIVIGRAAHDVGPDVALEHVFGYATANDISLRSLTLGHERDAAPIVGFFDWLVGKWADGSAPVGPYLVTPDEVSDPQDLPLRLEVNGTVMQESSTSEMIFGCAELIAFASRLCTLQPGDIILTGTPAGTGVASSIYLAAGDQVTAEVAGLGRLTTPIIATG